MDDPRRSSVFAYEPADELEALIERGNLARIASYAAIEESRQQRQTLLYEIASTRRNVRQLVHLKRQSARKY